MPLTDDMNEQVNEMLAEHEFFDTDQSGFRAITPDPTKYHEVKGDLAISMPRAAGATMIPRAKKGDDGGSLGLDASRPMIINVDPHIPGGSSVVDLGAVTKEQMAAAYNPKCSSNQRVVAATAYRNLAIGTSPVKTWITSPKTTRPVKAASAAIVQQELSEDELVPLPPVEVPMETEGYPPSPPRRQTRPLAPAYIPPPIAVPASRPSDIVKRQQQKASQVDTRQRFTASSGDVRPPESVVTFEIPGFGTFDTAYHKVVKDGTNLILIYDRRWIYGLKYMPQQSDALLLIDVHEHSQVYKVHSVGIQYTIDDHDHCVLLIEEEADKQVRS